MNTMKFYFLFFVILIKCSVFGQITLEYVDTNNEYFLGTTFYAVDIDENETKYFFQNTTNNQFSLYNMDFTPFITNIQLPGTYDVDYNVIYISRKLFDCDESNIEFIYTPANDVTKTFKILRTDGTELFSQDSTYGIYCFGCMSGSQDIRPVRKTSAGTKLFLAKFVPSSPNNAVQNQIYSLCGDLPAGYPEIQNTQLVKAKVYPNPSVGEISFEVNLPSNIESYDLTIYDSSGKKVYQENGVKTSKHVINTSTFNSGTYFYKLTNKNKTISIGKLTSIK